MCVPQPQEQAAPANQVPSMQSANNLALGGSGAPIGSANLGRLALRLGAPTGIPASPPPRPAVGATPAPGGFPVVAPGSILANVPNAGLRLH